MPIIHGSGDCAVEVRRVLLEQKFDCLAVPLPPSFQRDVERAIEHLPAITVVTQAEPHEYRSTDWNPDRDTAGDAVHGDDGDDAAKAISYVPVDPCQPVIAALRIAREEHLPRAFIDLETAVFEPVSAGLPDPYTHRFVVGRSG